MEELQLTLTPARVDQRNFGVMLSNWRVGQVINALVVDRMPSGNVLLNAGGREFVTPLDLPVQPGTRLQLEVQQVTPQLTLRLMLGSEKSGLLPGAESLNRPTQTAIGPAAPTPLGGGTTLASVLSAAATQPNLRALVNQSPVLSALVSSLSSQVLQSSTLSAGLLSQAVAQSGLFTEANLLAGRNGSLRTNMKTQLIQLQRGIAEMAGNSLGTEARVALSNLSDLTNAALANLNQQQLISMPQENAGQRWAFNLPMEWAGFVIDLAMTIEHCIDEDDVAGGEVKDEWRVHLNLELPELGRLKALVTLSGSDISVAFTSDSDRVRRVFESSFGELRDRMIVSDFRVRELTLHQGAEVTQSADAASSRFEVRV
jgi:flagellar hook-length control protein FliK